MLLERAGDEAGDARLDQLGNAPASESDDRAAGEHRFDEGESERLVPVDRREQRPRVAEQRHLLLGTDAAEAGHVRGLEPGLHLACWRYS